MRKLETIRKGIEKALAEIDKVSGTRVDRAGAKKRFAEAFDSLVERHTPSNLGLAKDALVNPNCGPRDVADALVDKHDLAKSLSGLMLKAMADAMKRNLEQTLLEDLPDDGMSEEERQKQLAHLQRKLRRLEVEEEVVRRALAGYVLPRADLTNVALLIATDDELQELVEAA